MVRQIKKEFVVEDWNPRTSLGRMVKSKEITEIDDILDKGLRIMEPEIVDVLLPNLEVSLIEVGQSKGKFGGGKGSIWKQTQKVTKEGNAITFTTYVVVGNKDGYVGLGRGSAKETVPAREKAIRDAKKNVIRIRRGCGSWACGCGDSHSIPFEVSGKMSSSNIVLKTAPKGTGLSVQKHCQKILELAGIKDVYSKTFGQTKTRVNMVKACFEALKALSKVKIQADFVKKAGVVEGYEK